VAANSLNRASRLELWVPEGCDDWNSRCAFRPCGGTLVEQLNAGTAIGAGLALSGMTLNELWGGYLAVGGTHSLAQLRDYAAGSTIWTDLEHDFAAQALNDYFTDQGLDHPVAYAREL
jgi:hypothetical protein